MDGANEVSSVIYRRITKQELDLDPRGDRFADWLPRTGDPQFDRYLASLADAADDRRGELGEQTAQQPPAWALEAFGPVPADLDERVEWVGRAGQVAVYREQMGHDDPSVAIGQPPKPGLIEPYASWRSAWRALGRPETATDEQQLSDGRLRLRVRAYEREQAWAPPSVANKLAGTIQAAEHHHRTATLRAAEADAAADPAEKARLHEEATGRAELARMLEAEVPTLRELDAVRQQYVEHTAGSREVAERADVELAHRHASDAEPEPRVTAEQWMQAHHEAMADEDAYRDISDTDVADTENADPDAGADQADHPGRHSGTHRAAGVEEDPRELAGRGEPAFDEDTVNTLNAEEARIAVDKARRAVEVMHRREAGDADRAAEDAAQAERVALWQHTDQQAGEELEHTDSQHTAQEVQL
jgi:hypothetical protein